MASYVEQNNISTSGDAVTLAADDNVYVAQGVTVASASGNSIYDPSYGNIDVDGHLYGVDGIQIGASGVTSNIYVGEGAGVIGGYIAAAIAGSVNLTNDGTIGGGSFYGIYMDSFAGDQYNIINNGKIRATIAYSGAGGVDNFVNTGEIDGQINLGYSGGLFDSTLGKVNGTITAGAGGDTVIAGQTGGSVLGGSGNDVLMANPTQAAANNAAKFMLDGGHGTNALYGDGAFTTFLAGDTAGGYNQIWGGASQMVGIPGYTNNTLSFATTPSGESVYVDLLNGHNAYVNSNATKTGTYTYEDSIVNVPNVIGSAANDFIQADNGTDRIQGGVGADVLYAGTGKDTFVYTGYGDSNTATGYDSITGFKTGIDKLDLSALATNGSHLAIYSSGNSTSLYLEHTPGTITSADLAVGFTGANAIKASDVIF